jgi:hypothetical protein
VIVEEGGSCTDGGRNLLSLCLTLVLVDVVFCLGFCGGEERTQEGNSGISV